MDKLMWEPNATNSSIEEAWVEQSGGRLINLYVEEVDAESYSWGVSLHQWDGVEAYDELDYWHGVARTRDAAKGYAFHKALDLV